MAFEQKDGSGALFRNEDKAAETHADYKGSIRIAGQEYWLSAWLKTSKNGKKYMSLSTQPKLARDIRGAVAHKEPAKFEDDAEIPF